MDTSHSTQRAAISCRFLYSIKPDSVSSNSHQRTNAWGQLSCIGPKKQKSLSARMPWFPAFPSQLLVSLTTWGAWLGYWASWKTHSLVLQILGSRFWLVYCTLTWKWLLGIKGARISFRVILFQNLIVWVFRHLIKTSSHSFDRSIIFVWILSWQWLLGILLSASFCDSGIVSIVRHLKKKNAHVPLINRFKSECELKQVSMNKLGCVW